MKTTDTFTFNTKWGTSYENCRFETNRYSNGNKYLAIWSEDEGDIITCSVNANRVCPEDEIGIKNYSENEGMVKILQDLGIVGSEPTEVERSGFVIIPYFKLTESGKELFATEE